MSTATVTRNVVFELLPVGQPGENLPPIPVRTRLRWTGRDPHAIELTFTTGAGRTVCWHLDRDLLITGTEGTPVGLGDVSIFPSLDAPNRRELILSSPDGRAGFRFRAADLIRFLTRVASAVAADAGPAHQEHR